MIQIIHNEKGYHVVNVTLGCIIDTLATEQEATEFLRDNTTVIEFSGTEYNEEKRIFDEVSGIIIVSF